jgi:hypothetical protein
MFGAIKIFSHGHNPSRRLAATKKIALKRRLWSRV